MGSVYFGPKTAERVHLLQGKSGVAGEVVDLRNDMDEALVTAEANGFFRVDQWTNPPASVDDHFVAALASSAAAQILRAAAGDFANTSIATGPRGVIITRSAAVGAYTTDDITIIGTAYGERIVLTFTPADADGGDIIQSNEDLGLDTIIEVQFPAQVSGAGAFDVGFNNELVMFRGLKDLAGISTPLREVEAGVVVVTGVFSGRKYAPPVNVPNGVRDYALVYVGDAAA